MSTWKELRWGDWGWGYMIRLFICSVFVVLFVGSLVCLIVVLFVSLYLCYHYCVYLFFICLYAFCLFVFLND